MKARLRQVAMVGHDYDDTERLLRAVFDLEVAYRDPGDRPANEAGVSIFGLRNFVMPIGNQFLELVAPRPGAGSTAGGRYIERRGGPGGYMLLFQVRRDDFAAVRRRVDSLGIRLAAGDDIGDPSSEAIHLHPKDLPGAIVEFRWCEGEEQPDGDWWPVEKDWRKAVRTDVIDAITGAEIQTPNPDELAARWAAVLDTEVTPDDHGRPTVAIDGAAVRFVPPTDGRPEGLGAIDVHVVDAERALRAAAAAGCPVNGSRITIGGLRFRLTDGAGGETIGGQSDREGGGA